MTKTQSANWPQRFSNLEKNIQQWLNSRTVLTIAAIYTLAHFLHGGFGYEGYHDLSTVLNEARKWLKNPNIPLEFGAYPPLARLCLIPFSFLEDRHAAYIFRGLSLISLYYIFSIVSQWVLPNHRRRWLVLTLILALNYRPLLMALNMAKVEILLLNLIVGAIQYYRQGKDHWTGALLCFGAAIKFIPGILLFYFLWKREWKVGISAFVTGIILLAVTLAAFGFEYHVKYVNTILAGGHYFWIDNQSLEGFLLRLRFGIPGNGHANIDPHILSTQTSYAYATLIKSLRFIVFGLLLVTTWGKIRNRLGSRLHWEIGLWLVMLPFVLRFFRDYYSIFFLYLVFAWAKEWIENSDAVPKATTLLLAGAYTLAGQGFPLGIFTRLPQFTVYTNFDYFLFLSIPFYGTILYLLAALWRRKNYS